LFVQAFDNEPWDVARLIEYAGVGAVFTLRHGRHQRTPFQRALAAVDHARRRCGTDNLLVDRNLYSGNRRKPATAGLSAQWVRDQHQLMGLRWAVTDSGFCRLLSDVRRILRDAEPMGPGVLVALPMRFELLRDDADAVADEVNQQANPVAVMLEHEADPFDERGVVPGLTHLTARRTPGVTLLRSDTSALGALGHGAWAGAVGLHSGLRHIYPESTGGAPEQLSFLIPDLLGYFRQKRFEQAYLQDPAMDTWRCACWFCAARDLTWIGNQPERLKFRAGFQHSVTALSHLHTALRLHSGQHGGGQAWTRMCTDALAAHAQVANPSGSAWEPKPALTMWRSTTETSGVS
jgi:hypothetical protein